MSKLMALHGQFLIAPKANSNVGLSISFVLIDVQRLGSISYTSRTTSVSV